MIAAIIRSVIRFRWLVWAHHRARWSSLSVYALRTAPLDAIPDIADPQVIVYTQVAAQPARHRDRGHRADHPRARRLAGDPVDPRDLAHGVLVRLRHPARRRHAGQPFASTSPIASTRSATQLPADANVVIGPNASSVGWIFQYALVDKERTRDLRELRLLNESTVKPALQSAAGVAEVASVGGLEKQYQVRLLPPLLE